jgi:hypothetical protein
MIALMFKLIRPTAGQGGPVICPSNSHQSPAKKTRHQITEAELNSEGRAFHESTLDVDADGLPLWLGTDRKIYSGFSKSGAALIWNESPNGVEWTSFEDTHDPYCYLDFGDFDLFYTKNQRAIEGAQRVRDAASCRMNLLSPEHAHRSHWQRWINDATSAINQLSERERA